MYNFGNKSKAHLKQCHPALRLILMAALANSRVDFGVTESFRDEETQNRYFAEGKSKVKFPKGKHNSFPAEAVDLVAYVNGKATYDNKYYIYLYGLISGVAESLKAQTGFVIRSGLDWDMDGEMMTDQTFNDGCHFELRKI